MILCTYPADIHRNTPYMLPATCIPKHINCFVVNFVVYTQCVVAGVDEIDSIHYHLVAGDLRDTKELDQKLLAARIDKE